MKVTRTTHVACKFNSKFSYIGLFGTQGGGAPPTVRKAVAFEIIVKRGHVKGYRTALIANLAGAHPSLRYDPRRCARDQVDGVGFAESRSCLYEAYPIAVRSRVATV